jgi:hypothetical protein
MLGISDGARKRGEGYATTSVQEFRGGYFREIADGD